MAAPLNSQVLVLFQLRRLTEQGGHHHTQQSGHKEHRDKQGIVGEQRADTPIVGKSPNQPGQRRPGNEKTAYRRPFQIDRIVKGKGLAFQNCVQHLFCLPKNHSGAASAEQQKQAQHHPDLPLARCSQHPNNRVPNRSKKPNKLERAVVFQQPGIPSADIKCGHTRNQKQHNQIAHKRNDNKDPKRSGQPLHSSLFHGKFLPSVGPILTQRKLIVNIFLLFFDKSQDKGKAPLRKGALAVLGKMVAPGPQGTLRALGAAGDTHRPAVEDHAVAEVVGLLRGEYGPQLLFHLGGVLGTVGKAQQAGDADTVGVGHHHAGGVVHVPQNQVGGLPPHAGELQQVLHGVGDPPAIIPNQHLGGQNDVLGLGPEKAGGVDVLLHLGDLGVCQRLQGGEPGIQRRGHLVHPLVGTLGGQPDGKQELIVLFIVQGADAVRVEHLQLLYNGADILGGLVHGGSPLCRCLGGQSYPYNITYLRQNFDPFFQNSLAFFLPPGYDGENEVML